MERASRLARWTMVLAALAVIVAMGCSTLSHGARVRGTAPTEIAAITVREFSGAGRYVLGRQRRTPPRFDFLILSSGQGTSAGNLVMLHGASGIPRVGRYRLIAFRHAAGDSSAFEGVFSSTQGRTTENFVAQSGELEIRESGGGRVSGSFRMIVRPYCKLTTKGGDQVCSPQHVSFDARPMIVRGTFAVKSP